MPHENKKPSPGYEEGADFSRVLPAQPATSTRATLNSHIVMVVGRATGKAFLLPTL
jgi:hypothetical protein